MALDVVTYAKSKKYTNETVVGLGALQGAPCTVESAEHDDTNHKTDLVLGWEGTDGTHKTKNVPIPDGVGIESIEKTSTVGNIDTYTITLTDGTTTTFTITNADGIPVGGTTGQVLMKNSNTDGDVKWGDSTGIGDMRKAVYDTNENGIVDNAEKVNNHTVDKDVPSDAKFTDTVYDDTALQTAVAGKVDKTSVGANSGVASLDANGKVPASELPSFVDDVVEGYYDSTTDRFYEESTFTTVIPPVEGKSWVDIPANKSYRWTGSVYVRVDEGVQIGETSDTAFRGDHGKIAYDDSQTNKSDIANIKNGEAINSFGDVETALEGKVDAEQGKGLSTNDYTTAEKNKLAGLENVQTSVMPVASLENVGDVVQYVGASVSDSYQHGYFYECKAQGTDPETYAWEQTDVQPSSSGGADIEKATYEETTALHNHSVGELIVLIDSGVTTLYKVTSAITAGDTISATGQNANVTTNTGVGADVQVYVSGLPSGEDEPIVLYDISGNYDNDWNYTYGRGTATYEGTTSDCKPTNQGVYLKSYRSTGNWTNNAQIIYKNTIPNISDYNIIITVASVSLSNSGSITLGVGKADTPTSNIQYIYPDKDIPNADTYVYNETSDYEGKFLCIGTNDFKNTSGILYAEVVISKIELIPKQE